MKITLDIDMSNPQDTEALMAAIADLLNHLNMNKKQVGARNR